MVSLPGLWMFTAVIHSWHSYLCSVVCTHHRLIAHRLDGWVGIVAVECSLLITMLCLLLLMNDDEWWWRCVMMCLSSLKSCFTGLQQLSVLDVWSTFNDQLQRSTDVDTNQCLFVLRVYLLVTSWFTNIEVLWQQFIVNHDAVIIHLSLIHIWRCRRIERCRSRWSPYH